VGSSIQAVNTAINGQRGFAIESQCSACGEENAGRRCSRCKEEIYCGTECQKIHWPVHKKICRPAKTDDKPKDQKKIDNAAITESVTHALSGSLNL
jgi:hypothetical protein